MTENMIFTVCRMITWVVFLRMFWNLISSLPVKRGGPLSFLVAFWFVIKQRLTTKFFSIFSNISHFEWRAGLSDTTLKGDHPRTIPAKFALIWFSGFREEDLNVKVYEKFSCQFLLYYKSKWTQILTAATWQWSLTYILGFSVRFFQPVYSV
jgi:hypothetical protein